MAFDYTDIVSVAQELIADFGRTATFEQLSSTAADPAKPWRGPAAPTVASSKAAPAAFVPASGSDLGKDLVSEELLKSVEQVCLVAPAADSFAFDLCDSVQDGGVRWAVKWGQVLAPGPVPVLYLLGLSR